MIQLKAQFSWLTSKEISICQSCISLCISLKILLINDISPSVFLSYFCQAEKVMGQFFRVPWLLPLIMSQSHLSNLLHCYSRLVGTEAPDYQDYYQSLSFRVGKRLLSPMTSQISLWLRHRITRMKQSPALVLKMSQTWWRTIPTRLLLSVITRHSVRRRVSTCE